MAFVHHKLVVQLEELNICLNEQPPTAQQIQALLSSISDTYQQHEEENNSAQIDRGKSHESQFFDFLIDHVIQEGIILTNANWEIKFINNQALKLLGCDTPYLIGKPLFHCFTFFNARKVRLEDKKFIDFFECGNSYVCENGVMMLQGEQPFFASYTFTPIYSDNQISAFSISFSDETPQIKNKVMAFSELLRRSYQYKISKGLKSYFLKQLFAMVQSNYLLNHAENMRSNEDLRLINGFINQQYVKVIQEMIALKKELPLLQHQTDLINNQYLIKETQDKIQSSFVSLTSLDPIDMVDAGIDDHSPFFPEITYYSYSLAVLFYVYLKNICAFQLKSAKHQLLASDIIRFDLVLEYTLSTRLEDKDFSGEQIDLSSSPFPIEMKDIDHQGDRGRISFSVQNNYHSVSFSSEIRNAKLNILLYSPASSPISALVQSVSNDNNFQVEQCDTLEKAIDKIKVNRLNRNEFQLLIFDNIAPLEVVSLLNEEVRSYINDKLIAIMFVHETVTLPPIADNIRYLFISRHTDKQQLANMLADINLAQIIKAQKTRLSIDEVKKDCHKITFLDMDEQSQFFSTRVLNELGLQFDYHSMHPQSTNIPPISQNRLIFIHANSDFPQILNRIIMIKKQYPHLSIFLISTCLEEYERLAFLNAGVTDFLIYPYRLNDLIHFIQAALNRDPTIGSINQL